MCGARRLYGPAAAEAAGPDGRYEGLRERHGAVAPVLLEGDVPAWLVLGYEEARRVTRDTGRFSRDARHWTEWREGRVGPDSPLAPVLLWSPDCAHQDGAAHLRLRRAVAESLQRFDRRGLRRLVQRTADEVIDRFCGRGRADLVGQYARELPVPALTRLLGLFPESGSRLAEEGRRLSAGTAAALAADRRLRRAMHELVAHRQAVPGHDLASWLIAHPADLSDDEIRHQLRLVFLVALETTANLIASTLRTLLAGHAARCAPYGRPGGVPAAVEQVLWDEPPLAVCPGGFATGDVELGGQRVRRGDVVLLGLAAANADPLVRPAPGAPMAGNRSHLAFAAGPHECPGQDIGRVIGVTAVEALLARLPAIRPAVAPEELPWSASTWSRRLAALPVTFGPVRPLGGGSPAAAVTPGRPAPAPEPGPVRARERARGLLSRLRGR
ncbi:cytochrome P450 family protein [Streptomyces specialis]|uniref:cytochrome P450 n=1 Tax=Streptomyces specialis TaxID=498367 RepID=UPI00073F2BEF|nr:cytochrome P450 [Streptomyces specialis]